MKTKKYQIIFNGILFSLLLIFLGCDGLVTKNIEKGLPDNEEKVTIKQGVWGNIWFWEGDFMPGNDESSGGTITPVVRDVYIYEATNINMVTGHLPFIEEVNSSFIGMVTSDKDGFFQISLNPGKYSFFVKEDSLFYATELDGDGDLMPAEVKPDSVVKRQIDITYKAAF